MPFPYFVTGIWRSGTWQLAKVIGQHPEVHTIGCETRFLVEPGGLYDLVLALTDRYTPYVADEALQRFAYVMKVRLTGGEESTFRSWRIQDEIGEDNYWPAINRFVEGLTWYELDEAVPGTAERYKRTVARFYPCRSHLIEISRDFVAELFISAARRAGKNSWCEKTPHSLLSLDFLWELFPTAKILHIKRHPGLVVASHLEQDWAPKSVVDVMRWLEPMYSQWFRHRTHLALPSDRYLEVKLEDLAISWPSARKRLFDFMELPDIDVAEGFDLDRALRLGSSRLSPTEARQVEEDFGWAINEMGYREGEMDYNKSIPLLGSLRLARARILCRRKRLTYR